MSEDLLSQLAEYGRDHRAEQRPVDVDDLGRGPVVDDPDAGSTATVIELRPVENRESTLMSKKMFVGGLVAAAAVVAILGFAVASGDDDDDPVAAAAGDPAGVVVGYVDAYNAGDLDAVMEFFVEESVITDHPAAGDEGRGEGRGVAAIRSVHADDLAEAASENAYAISNVEVSGNTVTWDNTWTSATFDQWCGTGHVANVEDGKIIDWTFAPQGVPCSTFTQVAERYAIVYNAGNLDALMRLFDEESVISGHPAAPEAAGLNEIRTLLSEELDEAASENAYVVSNVEVVGGTVTWDHVATSADGDQWCGTGNSALMKIYTPSERAVPEAKIISWTVAEPEPCA